FDLHRFDQDIVDSFETDWLVLADFRNVIADLIDVGITEDEKRTHRRIDNQLEGCFQNQHAGAFRADESARDVKVFLREQIIKVVTGNAPRNLRELLPDEFAPFVAKI